MDHVSGGWGIVCADWVNHPEVGPDELALLALSLSTPVRTVRAGHHNRRWPTD